MSVATTQKDIASFFAGYDVAVISRIVFVRDVLTRDTFGYAYANMDDVTAEKAISGLNGHTLCGSKVGIVAAG